jgi:tRNA(Ile)-lysidine synthase
VSFARAAARISTGGSLAARSVSIQLHELLKNIQRQELLRPGERIGVAVSGGADSVALLLLLLELREKLGIVLSVVHFNHKLRGRASDLDEKFVAKLAEKHGLTFHLGRADVAAKAKREKANIEDAARRARYEYFEKLVKEERIASVAVAHTADDQAETVLAHLLRGTGLAGLGGIHPTAGAVFRPLLDFRRSDLRTYLKRKKQNWREDLTNRDTHRTRARIRKKLLPLIEKQFQPGIVEHLATLAELAREDEAFLEAVVEARLRRVVQREAGEIRIAAADLLSQPGHGDSNAKAAEDTGSDEKKNCDAAVSKRMVRRIVGEVKQRAGQLSSSHVDAVLELASGERSGRLLQLPGGVDVRKERGTLVFRQSSNRIKEKSESAARQFEHQIDLTGGSQDLRVPELGCVFRLRVIDWPLERGETNRIGAVLDRDRLQFPVVLRNWRPGDRLQPAGRRATHKLKRLLNEKRISRWEREGWPVLTSGGVLAWARGFPVPTEFAANERTRTGMVIQEEALTVATMESPA